MSTKARRRKLLSDWLFLCRCRRCEVCRQLPCPRMCAGLHTPIYTYAYIHIRLHTQGPDVCRQLPCPRLRCAGVVSLHCRCRPRPARSLAPGMAQLVGLVADGGAWVRAHVGACLGTSTADEAGQEGCEGRGAEEMSSDDVDLGLEQRAGGVRGRRVMEAGGAAGGGGGGGEERERMDRREKRLLAKQVGLGVEG